MLSEEKTKSIPVSPTGIALFLYPVMSSRRDLVSVSFKHVYNFLSKSQLRNSLKSN